MAAQQQAAINIIERNMEEVMHSSMMPYAEYVIMDRAIPRVEDGLKPVQRRILYTMLELSLMPEKPHRKSARIVGDCLGKYHPHGDSSVYDAMVRLAQDFNMSEPLVDGHGNFGSVDGDPAAAMRYTEARMMPLAMELLRDIDKNTVSFSFNFDDTLKEPDMLPGRYPNLLVNGATGIAVGLATNIPPHNLGETIDATIAMLDKPQISLKELMQHIKAPDFPTGGYLLDLSELHKAYETGKGRIVLRAKSHIEDIKNGKKQIVITELPYQVNKANALEKILKLSEEKKAMLSGISDIRDESDRTGMRAVIELKKDADPGKILNCLYKYSDLQVNIGINMVAIANAKPQQMGLISILKYYINYQKQVVTKRTRFDLDAALKRAHILEGIIVAVDNIDKVIRLIRSSQTPSEARGKLMVEFSLTEVQAQAILDMRLQRLTNLSIIELRNEHEQLQKLIEQLQNILNSESKLIAVIKKEMLDIKKRHGRARRTELLDKSSEIIIDENEYKIIDDVVVFATSAGIKRVNAKVFASKGVQEEEVPQFIIECRTDNRLQFFTNLGTMYSIDVSDIPEPKGKEKGIIPAGLFQGWQDGEKLIQAVKLEHFDEGGGDLIFLTKNGMIKRTPVSEYNTRNKKFVACALRDDDKILQVALHKEEQNILVITKLGMSICFSSEEVPQTGRATMGVRIITLSEDDEILKAIYNDGEGELVVISERGYAKRTMLCDYDQQGRNGKGQKTFDFKKKGSNGYYLVCALVVKDSANIEIVQQSGEKTIISSDEIMIEQKNSKGMPAMIVLMDNVIVSGRILSSAT